MIRSEKNAMFHHPTPQIDAIMSALQFSDARYSRRQQTKTKSLPFAGNTNALLGGITVLDRNDEKRRSKKGNGGRVGKQ